SETDGSFLVLPQVILEMPVTEIIVSHFRGAVHYLRPVEFGRTVGIGLTGYPLTGSSSLLGLQ
ncbi:hypothetical protein, partial [Bradyrhizobium japonicum]